MNRPETHEYAPYYERYVGKIGDGDILDILKEQQQGMNAVLTGMTDEQGMYRYEAGKWSVKELLGHIIDAERIFAYRALCIARNDKTPLPGFEQDGYVAVGRFDERSIEDLRSEYNDVRNATLSLLRNINFEESLRIGTASGYPVSVRAAAYIIAGHEEHHSRILDERYLGREA